jgi:hypothetical protein
MQDACRRPVFPIFSGVWMSRWMFCRERHSMWHNLQCPWMLGLWGGCRGVEGEGLLPYPHGAHC